jgi:hypothetical protein
MPQNVASLLVLAVVAIILESIVGPHLLYDAPLLGTLVNAYFLLGVCSITFSLVNDRLNRDQTRSAVETIASATLIDLSDVSDRMRNRIYTILSYVLRLTCWPAYEMGMPTFRLYRKVNRLRSPFTKGAAFLLFPVEVSISIYLMLAALALTAWALVRHPDSVEYSVKLFWVIVLTIFVKHCGYLVGTVSVQQRLRLGRDSPYFSFIVITIADFVALALSYNAIAHWPQGAVFDLTLVKSLLARLFVFKDFFNLFEKPPEMALDYWIGLSGLLYNVSLLKSLFKAKEFRRTEKDCLGVAGFFAMLGMPDEAKRRLETCSITTKESMLVKAQILASLGEFPKSRSKKSGFMSNKMAWSSVGA